MSPVSSKRHIYNSGKYTFVLSGDLPNLSIEEIKGLLEAYGVNYRIIYKDNYLAVFEAEDLKSVRIHHRFSLIKILSSFLGIYSDVNELVDRISRITSFFKDKKFHVRVIKFGSGWKRVDSVELSKKIGKIIFSSTHARVDFSSPDVILHVYMSNKIVLGIPIGYRTDKVLLRRPSKRPFSKPVSMDPRVARAMVNMARVREGDRILDPFCGTGAILIEAGLMGMRVLGSDISEEMVKGTLKNLEYFGIKPEKIVQCDVRNIEDHFEEVDAIVCDPPYGRAASTHGDSLEELYHNAFKAFKKVLKPEGYAVVCFSDRKYHYEIGAKYMKLISIVSYRVHKSLTRYIGVYLNSLG
ncbi:MAG: methyltransferase domain-containing protein [Euryarchaeota archaeon]|nr:methyltransferase domain-containing protein [Euryarchaeota archaeon]